MKLTQIILIGIFLLASFFRFYKIDEIPHGLYIDEVSIGYNAYAILTTGKDEFGESYPLFFKAFGEYKMPVTMYLTSASIALFGKTEFAVRFPSALLGSLTVLLIYFFVRNLFAINKKRAESTALVSAFLLAVSPWHIQFSRGGFEANIALFFFLSGGLLLLHFLRNKKYLWLFLSILVFVTTVYTYNAYKLIVPVMLLAGLLYTHKKIHPRQLFLSSVLVIILLLPVLFFSEGSSRFLATSAFEGQPFFSYPMIYLHNYLSFFSLPFLFVTGDGFGRHTIVGMGPFFRWELPFLLIGLFALFKQRKTFFAQVVFLLLLIAPAAAALTRPSPHMLRSLLLIIPLTIMIGYGVVLLWEQKRRWSKMLLLVVSLVALYEFGAYLHLYYTHYPMRTAPDWGSAYKELVMAAAAKEKEYELIVINNKLGMVSNYIRFYNGKLIYQVVDGTWQKPKEISKKILYITNSEEKNNRYVKTIPHKHVQDIYLQSSHRGIFAQFWEL